LFLQQKASKGACAKLSQPVSSATGPGRVLLPHPSLEWEDNQSPKLAPWGQQGPPCHCGAQAKYEPIRTREERVFRF
jgi:hypothetical protein